MPTSASTIFSALKLEPFLDPEDTPSIDVAIAASLTIARGTILGELLGTNAKHSITEAPTATAGSFTLTRVGQTTGPIQWNSTAQDLQAVLDAATIAFGPGNTKVAQTVYTTGQSVWTIEYIGALAGQVVALPTRTDSLTGSTTTIASVTTGAAGTPGTYKAYSPTATDGSQVAKLISTYDIITDASGNITYTTSAGQVGGDLMQTYKYMPAYYAGTFAMADLVGLDAKAIADMGGRIIQGKIGAGIVRFG